LRFEEPAAMQRICAGWEIGDSLSHRLLLFDGLIHLQVRNVDKGAAAHEIAAAAIGATDSIHHDSEPGFLVLSLKWIARARGVEQFDASAFGGVLCLHFARPEAKEAAARLRASGQQVAIIPLGNSEARQ
jgi:hypothetical protein